MEDKQLEIKLKIEDVMEDLPLLNTEGLGLNFHRGETLEEQAVELEKRREKLLESTDAFEKTVEWLKQIKKIKSLNRNSSSYGIKHFVEKDTGYITNGVFIAAAIHSGFEHKSCRPSSINAFFNMSERSFAEISKRREGNVRRFP